MVRRACVPMAYLSREAITSASVHGRNPPVTAFFFCMTSLQGLVAIRFSRIAHVMKWRRHFIQLLCALADRAAMIC